MNSKKFMSIVIAHLVQQMCEIKVVGNSTFEYRGDIRNITRVPEDTPYQIKGFSPLLGFEAFGSTATDTGFVIFLDLRFEDHCEVTIYTPEEYYEKMLSEFTSEQYLNLLSGIDKKYSHITKDMVGQIKDEYVTALTGMYSEVFVMGQPSYPDSRFQNMAIKHCSKTIKEITNG